jgi:hypothetical protein
MKPTNSEESGCSPISSNCVIWQGPDLPCIDLCKGDTVSIVIAKLATELCDLKNQFDLDGFDFACLVGDACAPEDFQALLQLIITSICNLEGITPVPTPGTEGCPDCVVNIASCFYFTNPQGDQETTMQLTDYVTAIGNRVCEILGEISTINQTLANHENRIEALENAPDPVVVLPTIVPVCVLPAVATDLDTVLAELERQFCELIGATGGPIDIYGAVAQQCPDLNNSGQLAGSGAMSSIPGWQATSNNLASTINNIWLTLCDVRSAIANIQATCCPTTCAGVDVTLSAVLASPSVLNLFFTGAVPVGFIECNPAGTLVTITDSNGGTVSVTVPVLTNLNNIAGVPVDLSATPVNTALDLTITMTLCVNDAVGSQCQSDHLFQLTNIENCPVLNLIPTTDTIDYSFNWLGGAATFTVELYDNSGTILLQTQGTGVGGPGTVSDTFTGLTAGTPYKIRVKIQIGLTETVCPFYPATTLSPPCTPPFGVNAILSIP